MAPIVTPDWSTWEASPWEQMLACKTLKNQFSSVTQSCPTLCDPMVTCAAHQASLPMTNAWNLFRLRSIELVMSSNHLILCHPLLLLPSFFPSIRVFPVSQFFSSGGQSIGVTASVSVLPITIQD